MHRKMKAIRILAIASVSALAFACAFASDLPNSAGSNPPRATVQTGNSDVEQAAQELRETQRGFDAGVKTSDDVSLAAIALSNVRIASGVASGKNVRDDVIAIAQQRQQILSRAQASFDDGATGYSDLLQAKLNLAQAQTRSDLYDVALIRMEILSRQKALHDAGNLSVEDLTKAQNAYQAALKRFEESDNF